MLNIFYGRECMDRDRFIFDNIEPNTILLVPDQFSLQAEKDAFHYLNTQSLMDVDVLSFSRLSDKVIGETGGRGLPMIDKQGRHMLLTKVMNDCAAELDVYGKYRSSANFLEMANNMISELKQCGIRPEELAEISEDPDGGAGKKTRGRLFSRKLSEIAKIYERYEKVIEGHYIDTEDLAGLFVKNIAESRTVKESLFWVYGFDVFSPKNLQALEMLIKYSRGVNIVLTYDKGGRDENLFAAVRETIERIERAAENVNVRADIRRIPDRYHRGTSGTELEHIEKSLYAMPPKAYEEESRGQVTLVRAASVYAEAETAAAHVMQLVRDKGYAYRDIVIICNDKGTRAEIYKQAFRRYGIKLFADEKRSILSSPAAVYILSLMKVIAEGYRGEDMISMLKTGLAGFDRDEIEELENYVIDYRIDGAQWKKPFYKGKDDLEEETFGRLEELRKRAAEPVMAFHEKYKAERTVTGKVTALYDFLEDSPAGNSTDEKNCIIGAGSVPEKLDGMVKNQIRRGELEKAAETAQVWNRLVGVLDQLVEILGEENIDAPSFYKLLESGIKAVEIGVLPPALDGLIMGSMQRTRSGHVKSVMVLAANEGILPMTSQGSGLLSEKERQTLMEVSGRHLLKTDELRAAEERLAIYRNLSRPECELYMSMSENSGESESGRPSLIFERIRKMFPDVKVRRDIFAEGDPWEMIGSPESTLIHLTQAMKTAKQQGRQQDELSEENKLIPEKDSKGKDVRDMTGEEQIWRSVYHWYEDNEPEMLGSIKKGMAYDGRIDKVEARYVRELYLRKKGKEEVPVLTVSPTRLEKYSGCPFAHFLHYGLRARERSIYEVGGLEMGDLHHRCLDLFSRELNHEAADLRADSLTSEESPWMTMTREECEGRIGRIMDELASGYKDGLMHDSKSEEYRLKRMKKVCAESAWMMTGHIRRSKTEDMMCEVEFGRGKRLAPVEIDTGSGKVMVEGKIDRMDIMPDNMSKIIDYKSGNEKFDEKEARAGWKIQLMMYMRAASVNGYDPVATFYYNLKDPTVDAAKAKDDIEKALRKEFKMAGLVLNESAVIEKIDGGSSEVFTGGKGLKKRKEFDELVDAVNEKIDEMCAGIMEGDIKIRPKRSYSKSSFSSSGKTESRAACNYCPYHSICKFDIKFSGCEYEYI